MTRVTIFRDLKTEMSLPPTAIKNRIGIERHGEAAA
jgi:hypothetical protein